MNRQTLTAIVGTSIVTTLAVITIYHMTSDDRAGQARAQDGGRSVESSVEKPLPVEVVTPTRRPLTRSLHMPATLMAGERVDLYAKTSGYVAKVKVDIGDRVSKGDALLAIDVPEMTDELRQAEAVLTARRAMSDQAASLIEIAEAEVKQAEAEQRLSRLEHDRRATLRQGNAIPQRELDEAESKLAIAGAKLETARARVASAKANAQVSAAEVAVAQASVARLNTLMAYATVRAPFAGVITQRLVDPGAFVRSAADGATTALLSLSRIDFIRLALEIPEVDAPFVRAGSAVEIDVKALDREPISATVTRTAKALKTGTRTMRAEVNLENEDAVLMPGMYAQVVVRLEIRQNALMIPSRAVRVRGKDISVLVAKDSVAESIPVEIGYDDGIWAEILEGLAGDEQIIVSAGSAVAPGSAVRPVPIADGKS